jgi:hypothetical protein
LGESSEALFEGERSRAFGEHSDQYGHGSLPLPVATEPTRETEEATELIGSTSIHARDAPVPPTN